MACELNVCTYKYVYKYVKIHLDKISFYRLENASIPRSAGDGGDASCQHQCSPIIIAAEVANVLLLDKDGANLRGSLRLAETTDENDSATIKEDPTEMEERTKAISSFFL
ncbi:hypothetical protein JG687_00017215 [Phytophthora cactorum]|uniref:Uncharacterized protein n=1 Tax=Phytophthora cactorum TaxID=29920 RepID=A0A8T1TRW8_9STRA|nr:hypothetical protein GQ600_8621 [Phytophthora cactorum]KAG6945569.1 hypothetical protein JG687_00017215 [Phytophthora cactorum]